MEFDANKFASASFKRREEDVPVPDLRDWFKGTKENETPVWRVRGLAGEELARVNEAQARNRNKNAVIDALSSEKAAHVTDAIRELIGTGSSVPDDLARRIEMLTIASVTPECSHQVAVKLAEAFPVEFYDLTNKITTLTGLGSEPGKPKRSSGSPASKSPSSSAT
ncbi:Phage XkdN-like tail assembly chaperone protein, TAC [Halomonas sp. NYA30]